MMEEDASYLLKFMASNGLVANAGKTAFILLNVKNMDNSEVELKIGETLIKRQSSAKLLGMKFEDNQKWREHVQGKNGVISALNSRLYLIRRLKRQLNQENLKKVAESIYTSKIRYGLQLIGKVRTEVHESSQSDLNALQKTQNRLIRLLSGTKLSDKISTGSLLKNLKMLSVNQLNAQIKLTEIWKAVNNENHPISVKKKVH